MFIILLGLAAFFVAGSAAYFSVLGIATLFAGSYYQVLVMASALEAETLMGSDVQKHRGVCSLKYPCQRGVIQDWDDMQRVWGQAFRDLRVQPEEHAILMTESPLVSSAQVIFLRRARAPNFCTSLSPLMQLSEEKNCGNYV
jgi:hypothetical protein